jgi:hypothetical protein
VFQSGDEVVRVRATAGVDRLFVMIAFVGSSGPSLQIAQRFLDSGRVAVQPTVSGDGVLRDQWTYMPDDLNVTSLMPGTPRRIVDTVDVSGNRLDRVRYSVAGQGRLFEARFVVCDERPPGSLLDTLRDINVRQGLVIESEWAVTLQGFAGRAARYRAPDGRVVRTRAFLTNAGVFEAIAAVPAAEESSRPDLSTFLDSMRFVD